MANEEQRGVLAGMIAAGVLIVGTALLCGSSGWRPWGFGTDAGGRLGYGFACILPVLACLAVAIGRVASHRFHSPDEIAGAALAPTGPELRLLQSILQNTLEQVALATPVYLAAAALLPERWLGCVAAASALFVVGRVAFTRGYRKGARERAFGFALCFYATAGLLVACLAMVAARA